MHHSVNLVIL